MALGSTQPLTEISTNNISWGLRRPVSRADLNYPHTPIALNLGVPTCNPEGLFGPVPELIYLYHKT